MSRYDRVIAITNRHILFDRTGLEDFCPVSDIDKLKTNKSYIRYLDYITNLCNLRVKAIVLREKDLPEDIYKILAEDVNRICEEKDTSLVIHKYYGIAAELSCPNVHLPFGVFVDNSVRFLNNEDKLEGDCYIMNKSKEDLSGEQLRKIGVSCHSLDDVKQVIEKGANQIILGNIFETDCKKGLKGKGVDFLKEICDYASSKGAKVHAIGGISFENLESVLAAGADSACMMSGLI